MLLNLNIDILFSFGIQFISLEPNKSFEINLFNKYQITSITIVNKVHITPISISGIYFHWIKTN